MSGDIALVWDNKLGQADFQLANGDLVDDDGLRTAVTISLFTDARDPARDGLAASQGDPGGWWGDMFPDVEGDETGSLLWTLAREKSSENVAALFEEYTRRALAWMLVDKVASRVDVSAILQPGGILILSISIARPAKDSVTFKYNLNWAAEAARSTP